MYLSDLAINTNLTCLMGGERKSRSVDGDEKLAHTLAQSLNHALSITLFICTGMNKNGLHLKNTHKYETQISQYYNTTTSKSFLSKSTL